MDFLDTLEFSVVPLNNRNILMTYNPDRGTGSAFLIAQLKDPHHYDVMVGRMVGLPQGREVVTNRVFMRRVDAETQLAPDNYDLDDPFIRELEKEYVEFREIVSGKSE